VAALSDLLQTFGNEKLARSIGTMLANQSDAAMIQLLIAAS
jgi:hypothetical protein